MTVGAGANVADELALGVTCGRILGSVVLGEAVAVAWVNICGATV